MTPATTLTALKNAPKKAFAWLNAKPQSQYTLYDLGEKSTTKFNRAGRFTERVLTLGGLALAAIAFFSNPATSVVLGLIELGIVAGPIKIAGWLTGLAADAAVHYTHRALDPGYKKPWLERPHMAMKAPDPADLDRFIDTLSDRQRRTLMDALERKASREFAVATPAANEEPQQPGAPLKPSKITALRL